MPLVPASTVLNAAVLTYENMDLLSFAGPAGAIQTSLIARVFTVADSQDPIRCQTFQTIVPQYGFADAPRIDILVLPSGGGLRELLGDQLSLDWIKATASRARCVLAVGMSVVALARAGVLTDEHVVAPRPAVDLIMASAPAVKVSSELPSARSGRFFTAQNPSAAIEQCINIVHAMADEHRARGLALRLGVDWQALEEPAELPALPAAGDGPSDQPAQTSGDKNREANEKLGGKEPPKRNPEERDGQDWPNWRGPDANGVSTEDGWADQGSSTALWRAEAGIGHSAVTVVGDRVYVLGFDDAKSEDNLRCLDIETGEQVWTYSYPAELNAVGHGGGTLTTPTVRGNRVYVSSRKGVIRCLDAANGAVLWCKTVAKDLGLKGTEYGFAASPLLVDDLLIYEVAAIVALDAQSGELRWQTRDLEALYSTPTPFELDGRPRLAAFTKQGLYILDRSTGEELAKHPFRKGPSTVNASSPVVIDDRLFISSSYDHGCAMLSLDDEALIPLWQSRVMRTKLSGSVFFEQHLYGFDESTLKCIDLEGEEIWRKRGLGMGALTVADGRLVIMTARGDLVIADASLQGFKERSRRKVFSAGSCWTTPVVAHGRIFCRNSLGTVVCLDHRPGK